MTLARMLRRPRWAIPITTSSIPSSGSRRQQRVEHRDDRLRPFETEALVTDVLGVEEALEGLGLIELAKDSDLLFVSEFHPGDLDPFLNPSFLLGLLHVHVLDAGGAAIGVPQAGQDLPQGHHLGPFDSPGGELAIEVPDGEAVEERIELGDTVSGRVLTERIEVGDQMAAYPEGIDQPKDVRLLLGPVAGSRPEGCRRSPIAPGYRESPGRRRSRRRSPLHRAAARGSGQAALPIGHPG